MFTFTGFRDGHCHPLFASREATGPMLDDCSTPAEVLTAIAAYLAENPALPWLDCGSFSLDFEQKHSPTRQMLDSLGVQIPIVVHAADHHSIWVNTAALQVAGVLHNPPALKDARFDIDANGVATGFVREWDAMNLIYAHQPSPSLESEFAALERAQERLLSRGIVAVQDAWIEPGMETSYCEFAKSDLLKLRVDLAPRIDAGSWQKSANFAVECRTAVEAAGNPLLTCKTVKIFIDGVTSSQTACFSESYANGTKATPIWTDEELYAAIAHLDALGFQLHFHAIGDAAIAQAVRVFGRLAAAKPKPGRRPVLAHAELLPDSIEELRNLGFVVCAQPHWALPSEDAAAVEAALGHHRESKLHDLRTLVNTQVALSFGSDWPVSAPEPLETVYAAAHGHSNPSLTISRLEAVNAHSMGVAHQMGHQELVHLDQVTLDRDILACSAEELRSAKVLNVKVAGRTVWSTSH